VLCSVCWQLCSQPVSNALWRANACLRRLYSRFVIFLSCLELFSDVECTISWSKCPASATKDLIKREIFSNSPANRSISFSWSVKPKRPLKPPRLGNWARKSYSVFRSRLSLCTSQLRCSRDGLSLPEDPVYHVGISLRCP